MGPSLMHRIFRDLYHSDGWIPRLDASPFYDISYITFGPCGSGGHRKPDSPARPSDQEPVALAEDGTLNPAPRKVNDPKFREESFFDPRDIVYR